MQEANKLSYDDIREEVDTFMFEGSYKLMLAFISFASSVSSEYPELVFEHVNASNRIPRRLSFARSEFSHIWEKYYG